MSTEQQGDDLSKQERAKRRAFHDVTGEEFAWEGPGRQMFEVAWGRGVAYVQDELCAHLERERDREEERLAARERIKELRKTLDSIAVHDGAPWDHEGVCGAAVDALKADDTLYRRWVGRDDEGNPLPPAVPDPEPSVSKEPKASSGNEQRSLTVVDRLRIRMTLIARDVALGGFGETREASHRADPSGATGVRYPGSAAELPRSGGL